MEKLLRDVDTWLTTQESLEMGIADKIQCDQEVSYPAQMGGKNKRNPAHYEGNRMAKDIERRQIRVLIGNNEPNFDHLLSAIIRGRLGYKYDISFMSVSTGDRLLKLAESHPFDIFILIPNNIIFPQNNLTLEERSEKLLKIIAHLRATYGKPVMAISAFWTKDTPFAKKARLAGVSSYLDMPFKPKEFLEPFCRLLEIELDDGQLC
jgi:CheY-like chemotaxis protein